MNPITNAVNTLVGSLTGRAPAGGDAAPGAQGSLAPQAGTTAASDTSAAQGRNQPQREAPSRPLESLQSALEGADEALRNSSLSLDFRIDDATERLVITVRDSMTDEVIREIPPEEQLRLSVALESIARGETDALASGALVSRQA